MTPQCPRLLLITPSLPATELERRVEAALTSAGDGVAVLLRAPGVTDDILMGLALSLRILTRARGAQLLISRRPDVAVLSEADGVQLPESGMCVADARRLLPRDALVGCSRHDAEGLRDAEAQGADYATLSPLFEVPGKGTPLGVSGFAEAVHDCDLPMLALGGVGPEHVAPLMHAGAHGIAVTRAGMGAQNPDGSVATLWREVKASTHRRDADLDSVGRYRE